MDGTDVVAIHGVGASTGHRLDRRVVPLGRIREAIWFAERFRRLGSAWASRWQHPAKPVIALGGYHDCLLQIGPGPGDWHSSMDWGCRLGAHWTENGMLMKRALGRSVGGSA